MFKNQDGKRSLFIFSKTLKNIIFPQPLKLLQQKFVMTHRPTLNSISA